MFGFFNKIKGFTELTVTGADTEKFLNECAAKSIPLLYAKRLGNYDIRVAVPNGFVSAAERIAAGKNCSVERKRSTGARLWSGRVKRRILPVVAGAALILLLFWSRFYVWRIELSGNEKVSSGEILDVLSDCGVESGAFWPAFSSDKIRTELLYRIPELSWVQVNMRGSLAEVSVSERKDPPAMPYETEASDIIATNDGFIHSVIALEGAKSIKPGDAVNKGDVLISGIVRSDFAEPYFVAAMGSVTAEVNASHTAVMPIEMLSKGDGGKIKTKYALILGNNRINFYSGSSISGAVCDKIISKWDFELGDIFTLPVSIVAEKEYYYSLSEAERDSTYSAEAMEISLRGYIPETAEILSEKLLFDDLDGLYVANLKCRWLGEIGMLSPISEARMEEAIREYSIKADDKNG